MESMSNHEVLKLVFPLLGGKDLAASMLVSKQWQQIAQDDYIWKCLCAKICPSMCKKNPPLPTLTYHKLYKTISNHRFEIFHDPPKLSFNDSEFYFDIWCKEHLVFSTVVRGSLITKGNFRPPTKFLYAVQQYKMKLAVLQRFNIPNRNNVSLSVMVCRKDTNKITCLINKSGFDYTDFHRAIAFNLDSPISSCIRSSITLLYTSGYDRGAIYDVTGIEMELCTCCWPS